ncbi:MAG TPA: hypothetical protein VKV04_21790 [Verrucomicrobiae bacterium]|nr:hypothetical protein [Verrucomicrobiae bacterium]
MKITTTLIRRSFLLAALAVCSLSRTSFAEERTAFSLIKDANDYVGKDTRDKIIGFRSEKSIAGLNPNIWYIVYYDHDTTFRTTEVKFGAGQKLDVRHPMRPPFDYVNDKDLLDLKRLKVDSNQAIKTAIAQPLLEKLNVRATQLWLQNRDGVPTWQVRLWAAKLRHPDSDANIGDVFVSADDGKVTKTDLHIDRVD